MISALKLGDLRGMRYAYGVAAETGSLRGRSARGERDEFTRESTRNLAACFECRDDLDACFASAGKRVNEARPMLRSR
jgi:hypothetical protein